MENNLVLKCLYERGSVRSFLDKDISEEVMSKILDAGCHAATGGNLQPYSVIEIRSKEKKKLLMDTECMQPIVKQAPVNLLFCIDWHRIERWAKLNHAPFTARQGYRHFWIALQDTIIAAQTCCTAADALGLGSVYLGTVESCFDELKDIFKLPEGVFPVVVVSMGYPKVEPKIASKHMHDVMVHKEEYKELSDDELNSVMDKKYEDRPKTPLSDRNINELYKVTKDVAGEEFANEVIEHAKKLGYINIAQRYFGLHYSANWSRSGNPEFINSLNKYGFTWINGEKFD